MPRGFDKIDSGSPVPPRRNPFSQKIKGKEDLEQEKEEKRVEAAKKEAAKKKAAAVELETKAEQLFQELKVLYEKRMEIDLSLSSDRHRKINQINIEVNQLEKEREGIKQQIKAAKLEAVEAAKSIEDIEPS